MSDRPPPRCPNATSRSRSMCMRPSIAGTIRTAPANRNAYSASGSTKKPTSMHSGANSMQKPATILRKWWASERPNIEPSLLKTPEQSGSRSFTPTCHPRYGDTARVDPVEVFVAAVAVIGHADLARFDELVDPGFVLHPIRAGLTGDYVGRRGVEKFLRDNAE